MRIAKTIFILVIVLSIVFAAHTGILFKTGLEPFGNRIILAYAGNLILTIAIVTFLSRLPDRLSNSLGYLFLLGSGLKFIFFFVFFFPDYRSDGDISKLEFSTFFIPYAACLVLETKLLVSWLNAQDNSPKNR